MAVSYKVWLAANGRKGTAADALLWKTTHGVALGLYNPDGTPKVQAAAPVAATPTAPSAQVADPRIAAILAQTQAVPGSFNDQRQTGANTTLRDLINQGLIDSGSLQGVQAASGVAGANGQDIPNIVYHLVLGADGKQYRQAFLDTNASQNARGFLESSQTQQRQQDAKAGLNMTRDNALFNLGNAQQGLLGQEQTTIGGFGTDLAGVRADIAKTQGDIPAVPPVPQPVAAAIARASTPAQYTTPAPDKPPAASLFKRPKKPKVPLIRGGNTYKLL